MLFKGWLLISLAVLGLPSTVFIDDDNSYEILWSWYYILLACIFSWKGRRKLLHVNMPWMRDLKCVFLNTVSRPQATFWLNYHTCLWPLPATHLCLGSVDERLSSNWGSAIREIKVLIPAHSFDRYITLEPFCASVSLYICKMQLIKMGFMRLLED